MMKTRRELKQKFMNEQASKNKTGSDNIKSILKKQGLIAKDLRVRLSEFGIVKSEPTIYNWINNPLSMNRIESNAVAKALKLSTEIFDAIIQGRTVKTRLEQTIEINVD